MLLARSSKMAKSCLRKGRTAVLIQWLRDQDAERGHGLPHGGSGGRPQSQTDSGTPAPWPGWEQTFHQESPRSPLCLCHRSRAVTLGPASPLWKPLLLGAQCLGRLLAATVPACSHLRSNLAITPPPQQPHHHTTSTSHQSPRRPSPGAWHWGGNRSAAWDL